MGLDVVAYRNLKEVPVEHHEECGYVMADVYPNNYRWVEEAFPGRFEGLEMDKAYISNQRITFRAGSYGLYNVWRDMLDVFSMDMGGDFNELINFPDNEGYLGPVVCKKLYRDFRDHYEEAKAFVPSGEMEDYAGVWLRLYEDFMNAFKFAYRKGTILFC